MSGLTSAATSINEDEDSRILCRLHYIPKLPVYRLHKPFSVRSWIAVALHRFFP
jgi:hypothetical protein